MSEIFETIQIMRKNLGPVTAYKYAVQQGYTGTEQEFAVLMASYATVAEDAAGSASSAASSAAAAADAADRAEAAAEQAQGAIEVDDTLSKKGWSADAWVTGRVKASVDAFKDILTEKAKLTADSSVNNWALNSNFNSVSDGNAVLRKYSVTEGDELFLHLEEYGGCTALFQSSDYIPSSGKNNSKIGDPFIGDFSGYVIVPEGATFLIVSEAKTNTTNGVYTLSVTDALSNVVKNAADVDMFAVGGISAVTGVLTYASAVTFMTENFISNNILKITPNSGYYISLYAYSHGGYVGCWDGTGFSKSVATILKRTIDLEALRRLYPEYQWKIKAGALSGDSPVDTIRPNIIFTKIIALSKDEQEATDINNFLNQATFKRGVDSTNSLVLMHFSDIHAKQDRLRDIINYYNAHSGYINDVLDTGDDVGGQFPDGLEWWDAVDGSEKILRCIGNHDAVTAQTGGTLLDMETLADAFISPYVSNWGLTSYTPGTTYYYKDYDNGVRLIVLDCMHISDETQMSWLQNALDDALGNTKHVIIADHYPVYPYTTVECGFTPVVTTARDTTSISSTIMEMVDAFQDAGGIFACYITGHVHHDKIMTPQDYPRQFCINVTCASNAYSQYKNGDQSRQGRKFANAINLVVINPNEKIISIKRIGADKDVLGRDRVSMAYNYGAHEKIYG